MSSDEHRKRPASGDFLVAEISWIVSGSSGEDVSTKLLAYADHGENSYAGVWMPTNPNSTVSDAVLTITGEDR